MLVVVDRSSWRLIVLFNQAYIAPYDSPQGQLVLAVVIGLFAAGMLWLRRLAGVETAERFLVQSRDRPHRWSPATWWRPDVLT